MKVSLGNILPLQEATISIQLVQKIKVTAGAYQFKLPLAFYPNYAKHGVKDKNAFKYDFSYKLTIKSHKKLSFLSIPPNSSVEKVDEESGQNVTVTCTEPSRSLNLFYKTGDMKYPQLTMAKHKDFPDEVAVCASFVPNFEPPAP